MCMGYAKDIKTWACAQEIGRRDAALQEWGALLRQSGEGWPVQPPDAVSESAEPANPSIKSTSLEQVA